MTLTRVLIRTAGSPALRRAAPVYAAMGMVAGVVLGPNGMSPADLAALLAQSRGVRLVGWSLWLLALAPAARALFHGPGLAYLRWLPASRPHVCTVLAVLLVTLELPWALLFWSGGHELEALTALTLAAGVHALLATRLRNLLERGAGLVTLAALALLLTVPGPRVARLGAGALFLLAGVRAAWLRASEQGPGQSAMRLARQAPLALAQYHVSGLIRVRSAVLVRGLVFVILGAGLAALLGRANPLTMNELAMYSSAISAISLALAAGGLAVPMAESERALRWILDSTGTSRDVRLSGRVLSTAGLGAALGALHGLIVSWALGLGPLPGLRIAAGAMGMGVAMSLIARWSAGWAERSHHALQRASHPHAPHSPPSIDGSRVVSMVVLAVIGSIIAIGLFGDLAVIALAAFALAITLGRAS